LDLQIIEYVPARPGHVADTVRATGTSRNNVEGPFPQPGGMDISPGMEPKGSWYAAVKPY